ncbi:hypothetical protein R1sor_025911 [Riccia sorocarpa]|uniref:Uncharacterized protein n=1 Tax=Riccia sorocarpa TaxID=122646 RepID=A0ABD3G9Y3_9MARC
MAFYQDEEFEDNDLFEVDDEHMAAVLSDPSHRVHLVYVRLPLELRPSINRIFRRINDLIVANPDMTPDAWNMIDSLSPGRNESELRIVVKFVAKRDAELFQAVRTVDFVEDGVNWSLQIEQPRTAYEEEVPADGKPIVVLKVIPLSFSKEHIIRFFTLPRGDNPPFLQAVDSFEWLCHNNGVRRNMAMLKVTPPDHDTELRNLPGAILARSRRRRLFLLGCSSHICSLCGRRGHKFTTHDLFINGRAPLDVANTPMLQQLLTDTTIQFPSSAPRPQMWTCACCRRKDLSDVSGVGWFSAYRHAKSRAHLDMIGGTPQAEDATSTASSSKSETSTLKTSTKESAAAGASTGLSPSVAKLRLESV